MKNKMEWLNRKVSWTALLGAALLVIIPAYHHRVACLVRSEANLNQSLARYALENSALRLALKARDQ